MTCHDLVFRCSEFPVSREIEYADIEIDTTDITPLMLRQIDLSKGMKELYQLYIEGATSNNDEWSFVSFVRVIEFVSMTVAKRTAHDEIRTRLSWPEALRPDASFIDGLIKLVNDQREYYKQKEYIKRAMVECCDLTRITDLLPAYLEGVKKSIINEKERKSAYEDLSEAIYSTRNYLVHAKAAYEMSGKECPDTQLGSFILVTRELAYQVICWYANLPEHARVCSENR